MIFDIAVSVIIEFDLGDIELNQAPQEPVNIRKRLEQEKYENALQNLIFIRDAYGVAV